MEIRIEEKGGVTVASMTGKLDSASAPLIQEKLLGLVSAGMRLVLEMHKCEYVSSAGLRVLLMIAKTAKKAGCKVVLSGLLAEIQEVMEMTGFGNVFKGYATTSDAIAAISKE